MTKFKISLIVAILILLSGTIYVQFTPEKVNIITAEKEVVVHDSLTTDTLSNTKKIQEILTK